MNVLEYLRAEVAMMEKIHQRKRVGGYVSTSDFVLRHGREFKAAPLPPGVKRGPMKQCFQNSAEWVLLHSNGERLTYCEGYALAIIPVHHAWIVNEAGEVIERTWVESGLGSGVEYFGVPFNTEFLREQIIAQESWHSLIDDWENEWPLLRSSRPVSEWRAAL